IRVRNVTGVQTWALPIWPNCDAGGRDPLGDKRTRLRQGARRETARPQPRRDLAVALRAAHPRRAGGVLLLAGDPDRLLLLHQLGRVRRRRVRGAEELDRSAAVGPG